MRSLLTIKSVAIIALSLAMLAGCGRKNSLSPTGKSAATTTVLSTAQTSAEDTEADPLLNTGVEEDTDDQIDQADKPLNVDVSDKPFFLDKLL